jgi:tetratricopeptide (TPR) repeat protein
VPLVKNSVLKVGGLVIAALIMSSCDDSAARYLQAGDKNFKAGLLSDAALNYRKAIQKNPGFGQAYYGLGLVYLEKKDYQEAYEMLDKASHILPRRLDIKAKLAD